MVIGWQVAGVLTGGVNEYILYVNNFYYCLHQMFSNIYKVVSDIMKMFF